MALTEQKMARFTYDASVGTINDADNRQIAALSPGSDRDSFGELLVDALNRVRPATSTGFRSASDEVWAELDDLRKRVNPLLDAVERADWWLSTVPNSGAIRNVLREAAGIADPELKLEKLPAGWRPIAEFTREARLGVQAVLCANGEVHAAYWHPGRYDRKTKDYSWDLSFVNHSGHGLLPVGFRPLADLLALGAV